MQDPASPNATHPKKQCAPAKCCPLAPMKPSGGFNRRRSGGGGGDGGGGGSSESNESPGQERREREGERERERKRKRESKEPKCYAASI